MPRWNTIICFLLCLRLTIEAESSSKTSDFHDIVSDEKVSSTTVKLSISVDTSFNTSSREKNNKSTSLIKNELVNVSDSKNDKELQKNVTADGVRPRGNVETMNFGAVIRGFYVFLGLSVIVIMYFTVRAIRLGRKKTKVKKYGILANREDLEMTPLGAEDDEEDTTVFDLSNHPGH